MSKRVVLVEVFSGDQCNEPEVISTKFYDMNTCRTLIKARDFLIKQARAEYVKRREEGDTPVGELIYKFPFGKALVGYYHYDDGLSFLFEEGHPVFQLVVAGYADDPRFVEGLMDLFDSTPKFRKRKKKRSKQAA